MTTLGKFDHIDIVVKDPKVMADFLIRLGFVQLRETQGGRGSIELAFPGQADAPFIELTPQEATDGTIRPLGLRHMAFRSEDLDDFYSSAQIDETLSPDAAPRTIADTGRRLFNLKDPEGNTLQVVSSPD